MKGDQPNQLDNSMVPRTNKLTVYLVIHTLSQLHTDTQQYIVATVYSFKPQYIIAVPSPII